MTCYAESRDGHEWSFPELGLVEAGGSRADNVVLAESPFSHNFAPFLDTRPGVPAGERFKALAGLHDDEIRRIRERDPRVLSSEVRGGLYAFASPDGTRWRRLSEEPVIRSQAAGQYGLDSQNVSFWSEAEGCYLAWLRTWETPHGRLRTISVAASADFLQWSDPAPTGANLAGEHLYTSGTHPYVRAPNYYIALPTRFLPERGDSTDVLFMAARAGSRSYERLFTEAFIRPGLDPGRWGNRSNYVAQNVVPTGAEELSIYHKSGHRCVLRTDGFVSARAGAARGELRTVPLTFEGDELLVNYSTSAAGSLRVEVRDASGAPVAGLELAACAALAGDSIEQRVRWKSGPDLRKLAGAPIRLRFVMQECDLYSFRFRALS